MVRTWLVTGTSSGFGRILTEKLLARGDRVAATVRKSDVLAELQKTYGEQLWVATLDLTDTQAVRRTVDRAFAELGRIDVLVSNAAYGLFCAAEEASDAQVRHQIDTNLVGSITLIRAALPHFRAQNGGHIIQVSSAGGQTTFPSFGLYHATKWGIEGFCETVAKEVAPFGITLTIAEPGAAGTSFGTGLARAEPLSAYAGTPAQQVQHAVDNNLFPLPSDPAKVVDAMIASADASRPPLRLTLGSDSFESVREALQSRLALLESQRAIAYGTTRSPA